MPQFLKPSRVLPTLTLAAALISAAPSHTHAQATAAAAIAFGGIDKFLDRIETADLYYGWNVFQRRGSQSRYAVATKDEFGLEFSFHIGSFGEDRPWEVAKAAKGRRRSKTCGLKPAKTSTG